MVNAFHRLPAYYCCALYYHLWFCIVHQTYYRALVRADGGHFLLRWFPYYATVAALRVHAALLPSTHTAARPLHTCIAAFRHTAFRPAAPHSPPRYPRLVARTLRTTSHAHSYAMPYRHALLRFGCQHVVLPYTVNVTFVHAYG